MIENEKIKSLIEDADAVIVGAGAGLSTSAGFTYSGQRFQKYFADFEEEYGFHDMYSGGFYPYKTLEEHWAYWSRYIMINRYMDAPLPVYEEVLRLVKDKNYFVITTNVDHCFQKAGIDKERLFYPQGDYGLLQCSKPCHHQTYDNEEAIQAMWKSQGLRDDDEDRTFDGPYSIITKDTKMTVPSELLPKCPKCGRPMSMKLRSDGTFVEDKGWNKAARLYQQFLDENKGKKIVFLELGVGGNTPGIIKYPFWNMTYSNPKASYICINKGEAVAPKEIENQSICVNNDIYEVLKSL
ncbi:MAG: Sir2 silent information regulator family NAD-dependent deacetylase [Treponema sp.]|nr:Sir2 silent information regulator family NAD-dependent deacetylase [Treponema sp.]